MEPPMKLYVCNTLLIGLCQLLRGGNYAHTMASLTVLSLHVHMTSWSTTLIYIATMWTILGTPRMAYVTLLLYKLQWLLICFEFSWKYFLKITFKIFMTWDQTTSRTVSPQWDWPIPLTLEEGNATDPIVQCLVGGVWENLFSRPLEQNVVRGEIHPHSLGLLCQVALVSDWGIPCWKCLMD